MGPLVPDHLLPVGGVLIPVIVLVAILPVVLAGAVGLYSYLSIRCDVPGCWHTHGRHYVHGLRVCDRHHADQSWVEDVTTIDC